MGTINYKAQHPQKIIYQSSQSCLMTECENVEELDEPTYSEFKLSQPIKKLKDRKTIEDDQVVSGKEVVQLNQDLNLDQSIKDEVLESIWLVKQISQKQKTHSVSQDQQRHPSQGNCSISRKEICIQSADFDSLISGQKHSLKGILKSPRYYSSNRSIASSDQNVSFKSRKRVAFSCQKDSQKGKKQSKNHRIARLLTRGAR